LVLPKKATSSLEEVRRNNRKEIKIHQKLSFLMLDLICSYLISDNRNIRKKGYNNINKLVGLLDMELYKEEQCMERILFIQYGLEARLKYNLTSGEQVLDFIISSSYETKRHINLREISNDEVDYINDSVSNLLDSATFSEKIYEFEGYAKEFEGANPHQKNEIVEAWKDLVIKSHNDIRKHRIDKSDDECFSLADQEFEDYTRFCYQDMTNPSNKLATGMVGMNYLLNEGFESGRVYCIFGLQGEGKSSTLLNLAVQIKKFNRNFKPKDKTKKPCIVLLTMENQAKETLERLFSLVSNNNNMADYDVDEVIRMMREDGELYISTDNPIDIIVKYKPNESVDTSYIYDLYDELSDSGYEVITVILDYLNRIRSVNRYSASEERLKLGAVTNELKTIAVELDISIITASQFNRDANSKIDEAREKGTKKNLVGLLGRNNIAESMQILNNLDAAFMIVPEVENNGTEKYLGISLAKSRYFPILAPLNYQRYIHQPYMSVDSMTLVTDVGLPKPLFKLSFNADINEMCMNGAVVDNKVSLPDNSHRYNESNIIDTEEKKPKKESKNERIQKDIIREKQEYEMKQKGIKIEKADTYTNDLGYNPNWRNEPEFKYVEGLGNVKNVDSLPPEEQIKIRHNVKMAEENIKNPKPVILPGPGRYTDEYTFIYDPNGSKEERLVRDYNNMYGTRFVISDYIMLRDHLTRVRNHEQKEDDLRMNPFHHIKRHIVKRAFIWFDAVDRRELKPQLVSHK
jgi:uncharacterized protein (UPF0297 family)